MMRFVNSDREFPCNCILIQKYNHSKLGLRTYAHFEYV